MAMLVGTPPRAERSVPLIPLNERAVATMRIGRFLLSAGYLLLMWGIASWFVPFEAGDELYTDVAYNTFFSVLGVIVIWSGITWNPEIRHAWTRVLGVGFVLLAIAGWAMAGRGAPNLWVTNLENPADNLILLAIGLASLSASVWAKPDDVYLEPSGTTMNLR